MTVSRFVQKTSIEFFPKKEVVETYLQTHQFAQTFSSLIPRVAQIFAGTKKDFSSINTTVHTIARNETLETQWKLNKALRGMNGEKIQ